MNIVLENISKKIGDKEILKDLSFNFSSPNFYIIKGGNGAGKTTLLYILSLLDLTFDGSFYLDGYDIKTLSKKELNKLKKENISLLFSKGNLISYLTVKENTFLLEKDKNFNFPFLTSYENNNPNTLSGGEEIQVALNSELAKGKNIVFLDEVTSSLDSNNLINIMETLEKLGKEKLIILVSHDPRTFKYGTLLELKNGTLSEVSSEY